MMSKMICNKISKRNIIIILAGLAIVLYFSMKFFKASDKKNDYYKYKIKSRKYFEDGEKYKSLEYGYKCIKEDPNNTSGYFFTINLLIDIANYDDANKYLEIVKKKCISKKDNDNYNMLLNTLNNRRKEVQAHPDLNLTQQFLKDLYINNSKIKKCRIGYNDSGIRGVIATESINKGEKLVEIPLNLLITSNQAEKYIVDKYSKECKMSKDEIKSILDRCYAQSKFEIILYLLESDDSKFSTYREIIKSATTETIPNLMSDEDNKLLENTSAASLMKLKKGVLEHDIDLLYNIASVKKIPFDVLKRYYFIVSSRIFGINIDGKECSVLSPYIDMMNHNNNIENRISWHYDKNKKCMYVESNGYIGKGEEVFTSYGIKSNTDLYVIYGFTLENNERKSITLEFNNEEYECVEKYDYKKNNVQNLLDDIRKLIIHKNSNLTQEQIEISKFTKFIEICEFRLNKYPTKLENDIKELRSANISISKYNSLNVLISEKELLKQYISSSKKCVRFLKKYKINKINDKVNTDKNLDDLSKYFLKNIITESKK